MSNGGIFVGGIVGISLLVIVPLVIVLSVNGYYGPIYYQILTASPVTLEPSTAYPSLQPTISLSPTTLQPTSSFASLPLYSIEITYGDTYSSEVIGAVEYSVSSWQSVIAAPLDTFVTLVPGNWCGYIVTEPTIIMDLRVHISVYSIDGVGNILGQAGYCAIDNNNFPRFGIITLDLSDVNSMILDGTLNEVMRHEMGHVLGIGTVWSSGTTFTESGAGSGHPYLLPFANQAHQSLGGTGSARVEDEGGVGTAGAHWKETLYDHELMTGFVDPGGPMPLSNLTVSALHDLGYQVVNENAENYILPSRRRRLRPTLRRYYHHCTDSVLSTYVITSLKKK